MKLQPKTIRIVALLGTLVLVAAIGMVAAVVFALKGAEKPQPEIAAYAHGKTVTVHPYRYCTVDLEDCTEGDVAALEVPIGYPLQISLPTAISDAPWRLVAVYQLPDGELLQTDRYYGKGEVAAVTVESDANPALQLNGIEIQLPSAVVDETGLPRAHAIWSIKTA